MLRLLVDKAVNEKEIEAYRNELKQIHPMLVDMKGRGNNFLGWLNWPISYDKEEVERIKYLAEKWKDKFDVLLVCGIGGSYLGAKAALEMIRGLYPKEGPEVIFIGNTFSAEYLAQVLERIQDKEILLNVISKSGTTTETAISFRIFRDFMEKKYGNKASERIFATTDEKRGILKSIAKKQGYESFVIPSHIGGRYSVFTAVGLLPLALCGIDPEEVLRGSYDAREKYTRLSIEENDAYRYAICRRILHKKGFFSEMLVSYDLQMISFAEWFKQLFGESEGKEGRGLLPTSACFSTDLHSMGQFIQQGTKCLFETCVKIAKFNYDLEIPFKENDDDELNYLAGKQLSWVNEMMREGTIKAHGDEGGTPILQIEIDKNDAYHFGYLIYFFFIACGASCYLLNINPFDQPGVEVYKKNMFELLGKE